MSWARAPTYSDYVSGKLSKAPPVDTSCSDKLAEYKRAALVAMKRGDFEAMRLLSNHYPRNGTPALTPKEVQNLITRDVPTREVPKETPPTKNNKDLSEVERRELELHGLFGGKTRKHGKRSRRFKNKKSKKRVVRRRRTTRKH